MSAEKLAELLDELIARDPDRARRFIESNLARIALMKRLAAKKSLAAHEADAAAAREAAESALFAGITKDTK